MEFITYVNLSISSNLSGNKNNLAKNADDKTDKYHSMLYTADDIRNDPTVALTRSGMILFALLSGGDYHKVGAFLHKSSRKLTFPQGVDKVGKKIAHGLARCGFGEQLLEAYENLGNYKEEFNQFLQQWRAQVNVELRENRQGHLPHRTSLTLPDNFPDLDVLEYYAKPINSGTGHDQGLGSIAIRDQKNLDLPKIAHLCERYFEWGYKARIIERFRNLLWPCAVMHVLRRAALEADQRDQNGAGSSQSDIGTHSSLVKKYLGNANRVDQYGDVFINRGSNQVAQSSQSIPDVDPLISKIVGKRNHVSTGEILEYRIEVSPSQLVQITTAGIKGTRAEPPPETGKKTSDPIGLLRLWIPASILSVVHPSMVKHYLDKDNEKRGKNGGKGKARALDQVPDTLSSDADDFPATSQSQSNLGWDYPSANGGKTKLDPWFTSSSQSPSISPERRQCSGFFFTLPNPDEEVPTSDQEDNQRGQLMTVDKISLDDESESEVDRPLTNFDRIVNKIMAPRKQDKRKRAQKIGKSQKSQMPDPTTERPAKRQKTSSRVLDALLENGLM